MSKEPLAKSVSPARRVTNYVNNPYNPSSLGGLARARRWEYFGKVFPELSDMRVLDLGGTAKFWESAPNRPASLTVLNLRAVDEGEVSGDACSPPESVRGGEYDLVVSNSLIEHVGGHAKRTELAKVVHEMAPHHWVQTPYRYFPLEPHWLFPLMQHLPFRARLAVAERWPFGQMRRGDRLEAISAVHEVELLGCTEMKSYFPASRLWLERIAGAPKSMVAIR